VRVVVRDDGLARVHRLPGHYRLLAGHAVADEVRDPAMVGVGDEGVALEEGDLDMRGVEDSGGALGHQLEQGLRLAALDQVEGRLVECRVELGLSLEFELGDLGPRDVEHEPVPERGPACLRPGVATEAEPADRALGIADAELMVQGHAVADRRGARRGVVGQVLRKHEAVEPLGSGGGRQRDAGEADQPVAEVVQAHGTAALGHDRLEERAFRQIVRELAELLHGMRQLEGPLAHQLLELRAEMVRGLQAVERVVERLRDGAELVGPVVGDADVLARARAHRPGVRLHAAQGTDQRAGPIPAEADEEHDLGTEEREAAQADKVEGAAGQGAVGLPEPFGADPEGERGRIQLRVQQPQQVAPASIHRLGGVPGLGGGVAVPGLFEGLHLTAERLHLGRKTGQVAGLGLAQPGPQGHAAPHVLRPARGTIHLRLLQLGPQQRDRLGD
jgi:hypothetical protein